LYTLSNIIRVIKSRKDDEWGTQHVLEMKNTKKVGSVENSEDKHVDPMLILK